MYHDLPLSDQKILNLIFLHPNAYLLLSYLQFKTIEDDCNPVQFFPSIPLRTLGTKPLLKKTQISRNLKILEKWDFIKIDKEKIRSRNIQITILKFAIPSCGLLAYEQEEGSDV